jgi:hypothetical protein
MVKAVGGAFKAIGLLPNIPKPPAPIKPVTRDDARDAAARQDLLLQRRGSLSDVVTGAGGAEAGAGSKIQLG